MKTKPILNYKTPNYPKIELVLSEPDVLLRNMPKTWQGNKLLVTAMISFSLSACKFQTEENVNLISNEQIINDASLKPVLQNKVNERIKDSSLVAPIFIHGDGVGVSGCVMIAPPVYLSEEDAMKIILNELKKKGISFNDKFTGDSINIKQKKVHYKNNPKKNENPVYFSDETSKFYPDAYNKELNMILEFVSFKDYFKFGDEEPEWSSVSDYYIKTAAEKIRNTIKKQNKYNAVIFYDPVGWGDRDESSDWDQMEKSGRKKAIDSLKFQVNDFIEWLKKQEFNKQN